MAIEWNIPSSSEKDLFSALKMAGPRFLNDWLRPSASRLTHLHKVYDSRATAITITAMQTSVNT